MTFPAGLLGVLPKLLRELECRFVQRNLLPRDIDANLIIDAIPSCRAAEVRACGGPLLNARRVLPACHRTTTLTSSRMF